jgi:hypothetical protein
VIEGYRDGEWAERGEITLWAAAKRIGVCNMTALRMLRRGDIKGRQVCPGAPWVIKAADLTGFAPGKRTKAPLTPNGPQHTRFRGPARAWIAGKGLSGTAVSDLQMALSAFLNTRSIQPFRMAGNPRK